MVRSMAFLSVASLVLASGLDACEKGRDDCTTNGALDAQYLLQSQVNISGSELAKVNVSGSEVAKVGQGAKCKGECSSIPEHADDAACFLFWQMSCHEHFYHLSTDNDLPPDTIMQMIERDGQLMATKIAEFHPEVPVDEVFTCYRCQMNHVEEDGECTSECSILPKGAEIVACFALFNMTCDEHFHPHRYMEGGMPPEQVLEKLGTDIRMIAQKIIDTYQFSLMDAEKVYGCGKCHYDKMADDFEQEHEDPNEPPEPCTEECKDIPEGADEKACRFLFGTSCDEHFSVVFATKMFQSMDEMFAFLLDLNSRIGDAIIMLYPLIPPDNVKGCEQCHADSLPKLSLLSNSKSVPKSFTKW